MTLPVSGGAPPSLAKRILDHIEETCGVRSDLMIHDYGGEGYADGVHRKDCRWCALLAEEYAQRDPFKRAAVGGVPEQPISNRQYGYVGLALLATLVCGFLVGYCAGAL